MNFNEFLIEFNKVDTSKTKNVDKFNRLLIKRKVDVPFLRDLVLKEQKYHRTYFQVSLGLLSSIEEQFKFIEDNFSKLQDWWHIDQLTQFINKDLSLEYAIKKAKEYVKSDFPFVRRWAYVMFMPTLVKDEKAFDLIVELFKDDNEYYVVMAEAWLISYLSIYHKDKVLKYIASKPLKYNIVGKAIQKICDSYRVTFDFKGKVKKLRQLYKES